MMFASTWKSESGVGVALLYRGQRFRRDPGARPRVQGRVDEGRSETCERNCRSWVSVFLSKDVLGNGWLK